MVMQRLRVFPIFVVIVTIMFALIVVSSARSATPPASPKAQHDLTIAKVAPPVASIAAGTKVTITGTGFAAGARVFFNDTAATDVTVVSNTEITATVPANVVTTPIDIAVVVGQEAAALVGQKAPSLSRDAKGSNALVHGYNDKPGAAKGNAPSSSASTPTDTPAPGGASSTGSTTGAPAGQSIPKPRN